MHYVKQLLLSHVTIYELGINFIISYQKYCQKLLHLKGKESGGVAVTEGAICDKG